MAPSQLRVAFAFPCPAPAGIVHCSVKSPDESVGPIVATCSLVSPGYITDRVQLQLVEPQQDACARTASCRPGCAGQGSTERIVGFKYESVTEPLVQHGPVGVGLLDTRVDGFDEGVR